MSGKCRKKIGKVILWVVIGFLALDLSVVGLLFIPTVQTAIVNKVTHTVSNNWGTEISIKAIRVSPTLKLVLHEVTLGDHHQNDMITVGTLKGRLHVFSIKPLKIRFGKLELDHADVVLRTYKGEEKVNISIWAKKFHKEKKKGTFLLTAQHLKLTHSRIVIIKDNRRVITTTQGQPDIDYGYLEFADLHIDADDFIVKSTNIVKVAMKFNHLALNQYGGFSLIDGQADFSICDTAMVFDNMHFVTPNSTLDMDLAFKYDTWKTMGDFVDSVRITSTIRSSTVSMKDVSAFAPAIKGMKETFILSADRFDGTVSDFKLINLLAKWGMGTYLHGDLAIRDITHFKHADINLQLDSSCINVPELVNFTLPKGKTLPINNTLSKLGSTSIKTDFVGTPNTFSANIDAISGLGTFYLNLETLVDAGKLQLQGSVVSPNLNIAKLGGRGRALSTADLYVSLDGEMASATLDAENFKTLMAHFDGKLQQIGVYGYTLRNTTFNGDFADKLFNGTFTFGDPNFDCSILAQMDLTEELPAIQGNISLDHLNAGSIANRMHDVDSATAKGFDKLLYSVKQNPNLKISFTNFMIAFRGNSLKNINGYAGCDNIHIVSNEDSTTNDRLRLTAINNADVHKYILSSGIANATVETNYNMRDIPHILKVFAHKHLPTLIADVPQKTENEDGYLKASITTYRTYSITKLLFPDMFIAPNSTIDLAIHRNPSADKIEATLPFFGIRNKIAIYDLTIHGNTQTNESIQLKFLSDSAKIIVGKNNFAFNNIKLNSLLHNDSIFYCLNWNDNLNHRSTNESRLSGVASVANTDDLILTIRDSYLYVNDEKWQFNDNNAIHLQKGNIIVEDLICQHNKSNIVIRGKYAKKSNERLIVQANDVDIAFANSFTNGLDIEGNLSADITLMYPHNKLVFFGKTLIDGFTFNQEPVGNLFAIAGLDPSGNVNFAGGILPTSEMPDRNKPLNFNMKLVQDSRNLIAQLNGKYATDKKDLAIHAKFDTLNAGFIGTFLSGFSHLFTGTASGQLSFYANPDSSYFDGVVHAIDINMGIAPLGTIYSVRDQDINFNSRGIFFPKMEITDEEGNIAYMTGSIKHQLFKEMDIDLNINTNRIMVLNTPKTSTSTFYGDGFVSGDVSIRGGRDFIAFRGPNLRTLAGSHIVLQVTSANSTSQSDIIHFTPKQKENSSTLTANVVPASSSSKLDFDFTFNVTNDADIVLYLESIGGTMNARADGRFQLTYNNNDNLNLYGNLGLHSGDFKIALFNVVNSRFTLVPGGNIQFDGPLENMQVNVRAYKSSKTTLSEIIPQENLGNGVNVNAYMHINGPIMKRIEPTFSFELPNSSEEVNNLFYTAIDTTNTENLTKQFAYFLVTNNFMPAAMFSSDRNSTGNYGTAGINMFRNIVNNMLGNLISSKNGSFGITYNQATETSSAEYGVTGSANLLQNRITVETSIGYYDDQNTQGINNMYGDFSVAYNINKAGTWKLKAYTYLGERNENYMLHNDQLNYVAGVALAYKQDFNTIHRKRNKTTKRVRKSKKRDEKQ